VYFGKIKSWALVVFSFENSNVKNPKNHMTFSFEAVLVTLNRGDMLLVIYVNSLLLCSSLGDACNKYDYYIEDY